MIPEDNATKLYHTSFCLKSDDVIHVLCMRLKKTPHIEYKNKLSSHCSCSQPTTQTSTFQRFTTNQQI